MPERATYCPACGRTHTGICETALARLAARKAETEARQTIIRGSSSGRTSGFGPDNEGSNPSPRASEPEVFTFASDGEGGFDKKTYQREYMRKRREAAKK